MPVMTSCTNGEVAALGDIARRHSIVDLDQEVIEREPPRGHTPAVQFTTFQFREIVAVIDVDAAP